MNHENQYTELIAGAHFEKPKYSRFIYEITEPLNIARKRLALLYENFDVDTAVGVQLDAVGVRVGISRHLPMKLIGIYLPSMMSMVWVLIGACGKVSMTRTMALSLWTMKHTDS